MTLIITNRTQHWAKALGLSMVALGSDHIRICNIKDGCSRWQSHIWDVAILDGVTLGTVEKICIREMALEIYTVEGA